jgi:hypothetical protein
MSFGIGVGDIIVLTKFATETYRACKHSTDEFRSISAEVNSLRVVFEDIADIIEQDRSALTQRRAERLADLVKNSDSVLQDLQTELKHYSSLSTKTQKKYDILRFGFKDLSDIRMRIISTNTSLNSFYGSLSSHSHTFIRKVLLKYAKEVNMDLHEGSVLSNRTTDSLTTASGWKDICRELRGKPALPLSQSPPSNLPIDRPRHQPLSPRRTARLHQTNPLSRHRKRHHRSRRKRHGTRHPRTPDGAGPTPA